MSTSPRTDNDVSTIISAEPQLFVSDIEVSRKFYVNKLGFELGFAHGDPPYYIQIFRGAARLNLRKVAGPVFDTEFRKREQDALSATLTVNDADALFREFHEAGTTFHQDLRAEPWGARTFITRDPDGNLLCFAGPER